MVRMCVRGEEGSPHAPGSRSTSSTARRRRPWRSRSSEPPASCPASAIVRVPSRGGRHTGTCAIDTIIFAMFVLQCLTVIAQHSAGGKKGKLNPDSVTTSLFRRIKILTYKVRAREPPPPTEASSSGVPPSRVLCGSSACSCPQWTRAPSTISPSPTRLDSNDSRSALKLRWCAAPPKSAQRHSFGGAHCARPLGCLSARPHLPTPHGVLSAPG